MASAWSPEVYQRAALLAAGAHQGQTLPDSPAPYLVHLMLVAAEVTAALQAEDGLDGAWPWPARCPTTLSKALPWVTRTCARSSARVADGVQALTKDPALSKGEQMADSLRRIQEQRREIALVKLADQTVNLRPAPAG